LSDPRLPKVIM